MTAKERAQAIAERRIARAIQITAQQLYLLEQAQDKVKAGKLSAGADLIDVLNTKDGDR